MDDYYTTFIKKITFITQMVDIYSQYAVPSDFFNISRADTEKYTNKNGIHQYGTQFKIFSLINEYKDEFDRILNACGIDYTILKDKTIRFYLRYGT